MLQGTTTKGPPLVESLAGAPQQNNQEVRSTRSTRTVVRRSLGASSSWMLAGKATGGGQVHSAHAHHCCNGHK